MERIKLSSFELEEYDSCNSDHQEYTKYFEDDDSYIPHQKRLYYITKYKKELYLPK